MSRPHGCRNTFTKDAKTAVQQAFDLMGGVPALAAWGAANPYFFYVHIWSKIIPKEVDAGLTLNPGAQMVLNAVKVADPKAALSVLERLEHDRNAHRGSGGDDNGGEVDLAVSPHELRLQQVDEGGAGAYEAPDSADASSSREDEELRSDSTVSLPLDVSEP